MKTPLLHAFLVGVGGFGGALLRYGLNGLLIRQFPLSTFPLGTLAVNLFGCLMIGIVAGLIESRQFFSIEMRVFLLIGLLGGFTTFSTFGIETFSLFRNEQYLSAATNVGLHVVAGLLLVWAGYTLTSTR
ncbi:MAG: fluoride efflux transporter CrcB [Woeseia sp.]